MNLLRDKFEKKKKVNGTLVSLTDPCLCEIMGNVGYDAVWIDMEHTYMSCRDVLCHLNASRSTGIASVVRVPQNDLTITKKILEMEPDGIIFPMVRSYEEAKGIIDMTLYPPYGSRGFGPMRAIGYGANNVKEYVTKKGFDLCIFIQIEHIDFINELDKIAEIPHLDGFIFGPNDLSASVNDFLNVFDDATVTQIKRAIDIIKKHNKIVGLAGGMDEATIKFWSSFDLDIMFSGADWNFVYAGGCEVLERLKRHGFDA